MLWWYRVGQFDPGFAALGLLAGGGPFGLIAFFYIKGMDWGDVKLLAMLGVLLGWQKIIICMFLGSLLGGNSG
jgi:leader peptidase (prepilin peptidase)/N-methyltransferase